MRPIGQWRCKPAAGIPRQRAISERQRRLDGDATQLGPWHFARNMGAQNGLIAGSLMMLLVAASPVQAAPLTLGCSGFVTTTHVPKNGTATEPEREGVVDWSIVVSLDERSVFGFWWDRDAPGRNRSAPLPIRSIDANAVNFFAQRKDGMLTKSIEGSVDRITGRVAATENVLWPNGSVDTSLWDLRCKPTRPLF